ncbi:hypothetical protein SSIG_01846 [Streptomyces filamentosus NRRL 11379]|uniref:Predicted protein n=1 Tax=Streptomyces filamentosus NRRL 15998 TaxID=457431 RepID=D6AUV7_STRFL|nr:predicted protein [Streptomyces filamentosus NRRL 15998]EWS91418.1 hypothetical protein SSIG_01846 [Streptomyces filamentosus NRRL 11379]
MGVAERLYGHSAECEGGFHRFAGPGDAPPNTRGPHRVTFAVDGIDDTAADQASSPPLGAVGTAAPGKVRR